MMRSVNFFVKSMTEGGSFSHATVETLKGGLTEDVQQCPSLGGAGRERGPAGVVAFVLQRRLDDG